MRFVWKEMRSGLVWGALVFAGMAVAQTAPAPSTSQQITAPAPKAAKKHTSAKRDVGSGAGDVGMGAVKGVGSAAKGTGKAAADLATLHPIDAAAELGKGAASTGKNVGVGTVKGTGKMLRGAGKAIKHVL